jgi:hypothetical protein
MSRHIRGGAAALLLLAALLTGCSAPAAPAAPGADAAEVADTPTPGDASSDALGTTGESRIDVVMTVLNADRWESKLTLKRKDANCVRNEFDGEVTFVHSNQVLMMRTYAGSFACSTERSWATWTATWTDRTGRARSGTLEIAQINAPSDREVVMVLELKCWGDGELSCTGDKMYPSTKVADVDARITFFAT